jgi:hypothetical protein
MKQPSKISSILAICKGLLTADRNIPKAARRWQVLSRLTWELPTTLMGLLVSVSSVMFYGASARHHHGATFIKLSVGKNTPRYWAFCLGTYIVGSQRSTPLFPHEYGHYLQSRVYGPLYLLVIALPSLASATFSKKHHNNRWFEKDADKRSAKYLYAPL